MRHSCFARKCASDDDASASKLIIGPQTEPIQERTTLPEPNPICRREKSGALYLHKATYRISSSRETGYRRLPYVHQIHGLDSTFEVIHSGTKPSISRSDFRSTSLPHKPAMLLCRYPRGPPDSLEPFYRYSGCLQQYRSFCPRLSAVRSARSLSYAVLL